MKLGYQKTIYACFIGYIVQAIVNNFIPLLFLTFQSSYGISLSRITMLVTFNFGLQLLTDLVSAGFVDRLGYRTSMLIAHICAAAGLASLAVLPDLFPDPFWGLTVSVAIYAIGGGLLEVLVSPVVEACPTDHKEKTMSLLHSFYCWGHVGVILISTLFFTLFGIQNWKLLALFWALIPLGNTWFFSQVPFASLTEDDEPVTPFHQLVRQKTFWIFLLLMVCAGASEQAVSQWASTFAELGLGINKTVGDLAGPMLFAVLMGTSRGVYGKYGDKIPLRNFMLSSSLLCICSYLLIVFSPWPALSLAGCALCGLSVGIMWPGAFSMAASSLRGGGTAMFAFLALAGDLGCSGGPTLVGIISGVTGDNLKFGILAAIIFPVILLAINLFLRKKNQQDSK